MPSMAFTASSVLSRSSRISCRSVWPGTYSMTMYGQATSEGTSGGISPVSYTEVIVWWFSPATACASRWNRSWKESSRARSGLSTLMATSRPSLRSEAL